MDVKAATLNIIPSSATAVADRRSSLALRAGEVVEATVVVTRAGQLTLELGGTRVQAQSGLSFQPGQHLRLQVSSAGETPVLRVLEAIQDSTLLTQSRGLRAALPYQLPIAPLLTTLGQLTSSGDNKLPTSVAQLVKAFLAQLPSPSQLTQPDQLEQVVAKSGLFLEARLANWVPGQPPPMDLKAGLLRLENDLQQLVKENDPENPSTPTISKREMLSLHRGGEMDLSTQLTLPETGDVARLAREVRGAVANLEVRQLTALANIPDGLAVNLDLPVRVGNTVVNHEMRITQDEGTADGQGGYLRPWTAKLAFDLPEIGRVHCRVSVAREVAVQLWTEQPAAAPLFNYYLDELRVGLTQAGLLAGRLSCQPGQPPADPEPRPAMTLVDERA